MQLTTNGIVLRDRKLDENRRLTILTERLGIVEAWANGANKTRSRLAASTELLCYSEFVLFCHRGRYTVDKADASRVFFGVRSDLCKLSLGSYLAELAAELTPTGENCAAYLHLLLNALHFLEKESRPPAQIKALYELRMLTMAGYMPDLVSCQTCNCYEHPQMYFFPATGDLCCGDCLAPDISGGAAAPPGVLAAMRHITYSQPEKLFAFSLSDKGLAALGRICEAYLAYHIEGRFPTLAFYHSLAGPETPAEEP